MLLLRLDDRLESLPDTIRGRNIAVRKQASHFSLREVLTRGQKTIDLRKAAGHKISSRNHDNHKPDPSKINIPEPAVFPQQDNEISPPNNELSPTTSIPDAPDFSKAELEIDKIRHNPDALFKGKKEKDDDDPLRVYLQQACKDEWLLDRETEIYVVEQMIAARTEWCHALLKVPSVRTALMVDLHDIVSEHQRRVDDSAASEFAHNAAMLEKRKAINTKICDQLALDTPTASECAREIVDAELHMPQWFTRKHREVMRQSPHPMPAGIKELQSLHEQWLMHRERLIKSCTQLVVFIAKKYRKGGGIQNFLDLIEDGNIGLMRGVDKFSLAFNVKLVSYAFWWIKQSIGRGREDTSRVVRVPVHIQQTASKLVKFRQRFFDKNRQYPTNEEIAEHFSITIEAVESAIQFLRGEARLDNPVGENADTSFGDLLEDRRAPDPTQGASISEMRQAIIAFLSTLPQGDRDKMIRYYGLGLIEEPRTEAKDPIKYHFDKHEYGRNMTLEDLGDAVGLTRERIRQLNDRSFKMLKTVTHPAHDALEHHHRNLSSYDHTTYEDKPDTYDDLMNINPAISQLPIAQFDLRARHILQLTKEGILFVGDLVRSILANAAWWQLTKNQHSFRRNCFTALESVGITRVMLGHPPEIDANIIPPSAAQSTATDDF